MRTWQPCKQRGKGGWGKKKGQKQKIAETKSAEKTIASLEGGKK